MEAWMTAMLGLLALPKVGLPALFIVAFVSATLVPLGSEPALYAWLRLHPDLFWAAVLVATAGNTLGGVVDYALGYAARAAAKDHHLARSHSRVWRWLERFGAKAMFLSWLPVVGDPLCAIGGWLQLPFWKSLAYMALGKFLRYLMMTAALLWAFPGRGLMN